MTTEGSMTSEWAVQPGVILHTGHPRFRAAWRTGGAEELAEIAGMCWTSPAAPDGEDALHVFGFTWTDPVPSQHAFEDLMRSAAVAIDDWIAQRL